MMSHLLPLEFYLREDVVQISRDLLGKNLFTSINGVVTGGQIIETEAYRGPEDKASHAYKGRRTARTEVMFHKGGICYVYLCYGIHFLLNVVTNYENVPHAVLIRALKPTHGIDAMLMRRGKKTVNGTLTNGPGALAQALGIDASFNGVSFLGKSIWIEEGPSPEKIESSPRIGIDYAEEDAALPWRFRAAL